MYFVCSTYLPIIDGGLCLFPLTSFAMVELVVLGEGTQAPLGERTHKGWHVCSWAPETWDQLILVLTGARMSRLPVIKALWDL